MITATTVADIREAINVSLCMSRTVSLIAPIGDVLYVAKALGYEVDSADDPDGSVDVWGWRYGTPDGYHDWKLSVWALGASGGGQRGRT